MIRVTIQQPSLAKYRVPVFRELASRPDIDLTVVYGKRTGIPNVEADGFRAIDDPLKMINIGRGPLFFHRSQWSYASPSTTDVLILTWNVRYLSLVPGLLRAKANRVPTILWGHGYSKREKRSTGTARRSAAALATALLFYNRTTADSYRASGTPADKLFVAPNSLDQAPIRKAIADWQMQSAALKLFRSSRNIDQLPLVLYVSRLDPNNHVELLIEAASILHREDKNIQVAIIGGGDTEIANLKNLAERRGVGSAIRFLGAIYEEHELAPWFMNSAVFCYPENIGLSLLHAFGYGVPVITSERIEQQNPEIEALRHGENGLLYRHRDISHLAECLWTIISDEDLRRNMSQRAYYTVEKEFSLTNMVDGMEAAIRYCAEVKRVNHHTPA